MMLLSALTCQKSYLASTMNHGGNCVNTVSSEMVLRNRKQKYLCITCLPGSLFGSLLQTYCKRGLYQCNSYKNWGFVKLGDHIMCFSDEVELISRVSCRISCIISLPSRPPTMGMCTSFMCMTWCVQH